MGIMCPGLTLKLREFKDYKLSIQEYLGYLTKNILALRTGLHKTLIIFQIFSLSLLLIYIPLTGLWPIRKFIVLNIIHAWVIWYSGSLKHSPLDNEINSLGKGCVCEKCRCCIPSRIPPITHCNVFWLIYHLTNPKCLSSNQTINCSVTTA